MIAVPVLQFVAQLTPINKSVLVAEMKGLQIVSGGLHNWSSAVALRSSRRIVGCSLSLPLLL